MLSVERFLLFLTREAPRTQVISWCVLCVPGFPNRVGISISVIYCCRAAGTKVETFFSTTFSVSFFHFVRHSGISG